MSDKEKRFPRSVGRCGLLSSASLIAAAGLFLVASAHTAAAQAPPKAEPKAQAQQKPQTEVKAKPKAKPALPDQNAMAILIQTSVTALSQANKTGNYSVLHALGAPSFQQANPPAKLAQIFEKTRATDITPVILFPPVLTREPAIDERGHLRLSGHYKTAPKRVNFDLLFEKVGEQWRLFGISVGTSPAEQPGPLSANQADKR